ncbi:hypothetical protein [Planktothrix sp.]|uniref:hypothetical protein n=1 Tax=Planktothrix sp. TaxID=3088171 RepID=UPI0038D4DC8C
MTTLLFYVLLMAIANSCHAQPLSPCRNSEQTHSQFPIPQSLTMIQPLTGIF